VPVFRILLAYTPPISRHSWVPEVIAAPRVLVQPRLFLHFIVDHGRIEQSGRDVTRCPVEYGMTSRS